MSQDTLSVKLHRPIIVRFNDVTEFLEELRRNLCGSADLFVMAPLRVTQQFRQNSKYPIVHDVSVIAGYLLDIHKAPHLANLVELRHYCGDALSGEPAEQNAACKRAAGLVDQITKFAEELGLAVRAGQFLAGQEQ